MSAKPRRFLLAALGAAAFLAALVGAARWGVIAALATLPESAGARPGIAVGVTATVDGNGEPIHLAARVQDLRDYYFAHRSPEARREGDAEARGLRRIFEPLEVRTVARDADAVEIEVIAGPLAGVRAWMHASQFPAPVPVPAAPPATAPDPVPVPPPPPSGSR